MAPSQLGITAIAFAYLAVLVTCSTAQAAGESRALDRCVPADAMAAYFGRPPPEMRDVQTAGSIQQLSGWIITLKAAGIIPEQGRVLADIVGSLPLLSRRPHALVLLDVTSKRLDAESYRLNTMQSALIIDDQGVAAEIDRHIRDLIATYTGAENATITQEQRGRVRVHRLRDARLPEWAVTEWGTFEHQFVLALGTGAFDRILATLEGRSPALADDEWFAQAHARCHGATSGLELYVDLARIQRRVGEVATSRPDEVLAELHLQDAERLVWTVGFDGPALHSEVVGRTRARGAQPAEDRYLMLTGPPINAPEVTAAIPPRATRYAAFRFELGGAVRDAKEAYLRSQSPGRRENLHELWGRLEREFGFDLEHDLIQRLGRDLVFHNWPPHPLGVPLLCTIWIGYTGDRPTMSASVDKVFKAAQSLMQHPLVASRPSGLMPRLVRDNDGIWYLQVGLIGPAIGVADRWLVISYSREAVRQNLEWLAAPTSRP